MNDGRSRYWIENECEDPDTVLVPYTGADGQTYLAFGSKRALNRQGITDKEERKRWQEYVKSMTQEKS